MTDISSASSTILVRHTKRPSWGLGILTFEDDTRRRYHFKDGRSRTFKEGFYQLLERVEPPPAEAARLVAELEEQAGVAEARRTVRAEARAAGVEMMSFEEQIQVFRLLFPGGFGDESWVADIRGEGRPRPRKQDRQPAIDLARQSFSEERMSTLIAAGDTATLIKDFEHLLSRTNLVSPSKDVAPLAELEPAARPQVIDALYGILWRDGAIADRFKVWLDALATTPEGPSWRLLTAPLMLVHPDQHVCVHPTAFRQQAKWFHPYDTWKAAPSGQRYAEMVELAHRIGADLTEKGLHPRDLVDVYEFVTRTLRPAAKKLLANERGLTRG